MEFDPTKLSGLERYKLLIGCIVPRPIAMVMTVNEHGMPNLAPFSFFNGVGSSPMTVMFCPANGADGQEKDSLRNARPRNEGGAGEFVIHPAIESYKDEVALAAEPLGPNESEVDLTGMAISPSTVVGPPRLDAAPFAIECRTSKIVSLATGEAGGANLVLGEVVHMYVADELVNERLHVDPERLHAIGRMGGSLYCRTRDRFSMKNGRAGAGK